MTNDELEELARCTKCNRRICIIGSQVPRLTAYNTQRQIFKVKCKTKKCGHIEFQEVTSIRNNDEKT